MTLVSIRSVIMHSIFFSRSSLETEMARFDLPELDSSSSR